MATSRADVAELGTILGVWAHPDDEAYLSGGLMAVARDAGERVVCVTATRGEHGTPDPVSWPPDRLARTRTDELARCLEILGVEEHHWLGYEDGGCADVPEAEAVGRLSDLIDRIRPDTVLTFGPDGITGHRDHRTVSAWTTAAFERAAPSRARLLHATVAERHVSRWGGLDERMEVYLPGYPVTTADHELAIDLVLDAATAARKVRALAAQASQTRRITEALGVDCFTEWVATEYFADARGSRPARP
jgi:LmbE family N-acetylglucosaminyl deacetylase